ncbi:hypothetical protein D910_06874 [Dendroctonus ponderosae]|uniref:ASD2 domain-containing protein n=1 Tax=Dendroctonus ponderosae TaxID=77166 RepID=U4UB19_DENPD|nr:hypothetical protein D910_06874 [Dendroctonus ponderosae]
MSPNGHAITPEVISEPQKTNSRETVWPLIRQAREGVKSSSSILRKPSMNSKSKNGASFKEVKCDSKLEEIRTSNSVLPDVLPVNAKMIPRSPQSPYKRPTHLSFSSINGDGVKLTIHPIKDHDSVFSFILGFSCKFLVAESPALTPDHVNTNKQASNVSNKSTQNSNSPAPSPKILDSPTARSLSPKTPDYYPKVIEGLQLIQRTEVVLRVNTTTSDAASQTEKHELPPTPLPIRKKLQEEIECEKLSQDFVNHLPTSDRLKDLLVPGPEHKKPTDYVQGLFKVDVTLKPRPANSPFRSKNNTPSSSPPPSSSFASGMKPSSNKLSLPKSPEPTKPLSCSSAYFTTSEPKAKFLNRYSQDMNQCHAVKDTKDLSQKKEELVNRLDKKLEVLRGEALIVSDECKVNDELGVNVENYINRVASPHEVSKFRLHIEEVGKITSLLLGLSGRLARAENALMNMTDDHPERRILESKRDKLQDQLEEAKKLKDCIDKRSISVSNILYKYLNSEEYADYDHFINMKAKLIMDSKEINDKIKLGEEQLGALKETLIITD